MRLMTLYLLPVILFSLGILGKEALGEQFQALAHDDLGLGKDPKGWNTQRKTEPILNLGYQYSLRLAQFGQSTNGWGGQFELTPSASLGNLFTAAEVGLGFRYGWNRMEGFSSVPSPPGRGIFQAALVPKPAYASPHSFEIFLGIRGMGLIYTVIYDGSIVTSDDRDVERENLIAAGLIGFNYHHQLLSVRLHIEASTDFLKEVPAVVAATECNCSICQMSGYLHLIVPASDFRLQGGEEELTTYTFNTGVAKHRFCRHCGIKSFYIPRSHPDGVSVNVKCLDPATIERVDVTPFDGRHWEQNVANLSPISD